MRHVIVAGEADSFYSWPAKHGIWQWDDEIVVGFEKGVFNAKADDHSVDRDGPRALMTARSRDGGVTWSVAEASNSSPAAFAHGHYRGLPPIPLEQPIDFSHPDLALQCWKSVFYVSYDRCRTWQGPYEFADVGLSNLSSRTDYLVSSATDCLFFVSSNDPKLGIQSSLGDRAFCMGTTDGGQTFAFKSWLLPAEPGGRSGQTSTVRLSSTTLVSSLRRRLDRRNPDGSTTEDCWLDAAVSEDNGDTWQFLSKIADTDTEATQHNGNPPSLVRLLDGRLCAIYGYRGTPFSMRARLSADEGQTWGEERVLRDDGRTWDLGYPRSVVRADGQIVTVYYHTTVEHPAQHIAATIWSA